KRRRTLAGQVTRLEQRVRIQGQLLLAIFRTEVDTDSVRRPGHLDAIFAEQAGEVDVGDRFLGLAFDNAEDVEVVDRFGRRRAEDVIGHAVRIAGVEGRPADGLPQGRGTGPRVGDDVQGLRQA